MLVPKREVCSLQTVQSSGVSLDPSEDGPRFWGADTSEALMARGLDEGGQEPWGNEEEDDGTDPEPKGSAISPLIKSCGVNHTWSRKISGKQRAPRVDNQSPVK